LRRAWALVGVGVIATAVLLAFAPRAARRYLAAALTASLVLSILGPFDRTGGASRHLLLAQIGAARARRGDEATKPAGGVFRGHHSGHGHELLLSAGAVLGPVRADVTSRQTPPDVDVKGRMSQRALANVQWSSWSTPMMVAIDARHPTTSVSDGPSASGHSARARPATQANSGP
jgi:hypothetical protein